MEEKKINNQENYDPMTCTNIDHNDQEFVIFKFSDKINEILQCFDCNTEDNENNKKISINQIKKFSVTKINNFPPIKDPKKSKELRKALEICSQEKLKQFRENIINLIEGHYQKVNQDLYNFLLQSKKAVIQQFENFLEFPDISGFYDIEPLKKALDQFQNKIINLEELFDIQLKMKKEYECEKKSQIVFNMEKKQKEIENQVDQLKENLNQKAQIFKQDIVIDDRQIKNIEDQIRTNQNNQNQQSLQQNNKKLNKQNIEQFQFFKSNYLNSEKSQIDFKKKIIFAESNQFQFAHSESLDKNKSYHLKIKIKINPIIGYNKQLYFYLIGSNDKDNDWDDQNYISFKDQYGFSRPGNGNDYIQEGQDFCQFWENKESILNLVINFDQQLFELYDEQKNCYVKNIINQKKIDGELMIGIKCRIYKSLLRFGEIELKIKDIKCY
ncbi:hypothetical protein PPERSA_13135 [Pseudocohnilembus persalinus]|uniref:Uncharacterized protein n=1 Tax=Pseudocohnilembus persalinus TaxID=266149 RepID=A0A0V0QXB7_PSEPJ|nr:hypothetical protein PPERSA_13135 [Pseudocohnilembus persalinus]|eukprot:KRX06656.1 hypothetical protein PPERSA_13135 [Pseudocohnilembus persalinus]